MATDKPRIAKRTDKPWNEARLHAWLKHRNLSRAQGDSGEAPKPSSSQAANTHLHQRLAGSRGHDAAVLKPLPKGGRPVTCVDACWQGVHFEPGTAPSKVGHKAAARALSDLAATAARPYALLLAATLPDVTTEAQARALISAVDRCGQRFGAPLVGGDLSSVAGHAKETGPLGLTVTALGYLPGSRRPPGRDRAQVGQLLVSTGPFGGSSLGHHLSFQPQVLAGQQLWHAGATAMMDVSDGLGLDLSRIAQASDVRMILNHLPITAAAKKLSKQSGRSAREHALQDGEDHELLATLSNSAWKRLRRQEPELTRNWQVLGRVAEGKGVFWEEPTDPKAQSAEPNATQLIPLDAHGGYLHGTV